VLDPKIALKDQILLLLGGSADGEATSELGKWTGSKNRTYFNRLLRDLAKKRMIELSPDEERATILPPGSVRVETVIQAHELKFAS